MEQKKKKKTKKNKNIMKDKKQELNERSIKDKTIRDIKTLFEQEEDYYKSKRVNSFWNNNYIDINGDKNRNLSLDEYLNKIKPYLKDIIIDIQSSDIWKILQKIAKKSV